MKSEREIREKLNRVDVEGDWSAVEEMNVDSTNNPEVGAVCRTLQWVLGDDIK